MASNTDSQSHKLISFLCETGKLKTLDRKGWTIGNRNISKPESVAGHMYRMAVMSMIFDDNNEQKVDSNKLIRMSLVHDMAECIVGDITPFDGIDAEQKHKLETDAMDYLVSLLPQNCSKQFSSLFEEYEAQSTIEAQIVKELDAFDLILQAFEYEKSEFQTKGRVIRLQDFFDNSIAKIKSKQMTKLCEALNSQRTQFWLKIDSNTSNTTHNHSNLESND